ncbi:uncharacterized protein TNCT_78891 [Trichonephila clavata]|uniref:Uncharacterized protein n=1 Tax=Trichonephila clavata TaxID=2740835 RepID=A0A8X6JMQ8_TRICU|nr:uncharacterized protein TNCT_78891 [Trichonephila clavata]
MALISNEDFFSDSDFVQIPCEFCGELYPFELVIEHQTGCQPELLQYHFNETPPIPAPVVPTTSLLNSKPQSVSAKPAESEKSISPKIDQKTLDVTVTNSPSKQDKDVKKIDPFEKLLKDDTPIYDLSAQDTGNKLMSYGSSVAKRIEEEKPSFKAPSLPYLNNADQKESDDVNNSLSDNDDGECLEDFWRRAEIKNAQRLRNLKV